MKHLRTKHSASDFDKREPDMQIPQSHSIKSRKED